MSVFNSPLLLGFEPFERLLDRVTESAQDGYPPYNIEQLDEHRLRITLAVAGFTEDALSITVEGNQLLLHGRRPDGDGERHFLHRGIAARQFQRNFVLADGVEVAGARLENGLLHIDIALPLPETRTRNIRIESDGAPAKVGLKAVSKS